MARKLHKLTAATVKALKRPGRHGDGAGLYLHIDAGGRRRWIFLAIRGSKRGGKRQEMRREMGLGGYPAVTLADARAKADEARKLVAAGVDPIEARREAGKPEAGKPTFGEYADKFVEAKSAEWRNDKHRAQWKMTLEKYAAPLRPQPVGEIDTAAVLTVLQPIWGSRPETASRLRGRIESVLDAAKAEGHRSGENPARWKGHLDKLLAKRQQLTRGHHAALLYSDVPKFISDLRAMNAMAAKALEFLILTAARSGEVLGARWDEIDLEAKVWTVPATRMKAGRGHRVPLSGRAVEILEELADGKTSDFIFPGQRAGRPLSNMSMEMALRRMKMDATTHGFRSSFRDWAGEETHFPREVAEAALAHVIGDKAEQAYRRGDALEKRRGLMEAWAMFCEPKAAANVTPMARGAD
ncbi:MAG: integrase arm-type DNA-binding domain-containing protein [Methylocella sp.]